MNYSFFFKSFLTITGFALFAFFVIGLIFYSVIMALNYSTLLGLSSVAFYISIIIGVRLAFKAMVEYEKQKNK